MVLPGIANLRIRLARILNHSVARELDVTCWSIRSPASIPESIGKFVDSQIRTNRESFRFPESRFARRMQTKHQHHRHCGGEVECDFVANSDEHRRKYIRLSNGGRMGNSGSHAKRLSSAETFEIELLRSGRSSVESRRICKEVLEFEREHPRYGYGRRSRLYCGSLFGDFPLNRIKINFRRAFL
jgi:hypothetical protein